jgi:hypothetical protein
LIFNKYFSFVYYYDFEVTTQLWWTLINLKGKFKGIRLQTSSN